MTTRWKTEGGAERPETRRERMARLAAEMRADPEGYAAAVRAVRERLIVLRNRHTAEILAGHPSIAPGTRCGACVGILQVASALDNEKLKDHERLQAALDRIEGAIVGLQGV